MKLKELMEVLDNTHMELHSSYNGKLVASTAKSLEKYANVDVVRVYPKIKLNSDGSYAHAYFYIFGSNYQINEVKKNG